LLWDFNADFYGYPDTWLGFFVNVVYIFDRNGGLGPSWHVRHPLFLFRPIVLSSVEERVEVTPVSILSAAVLGMLVIVTGGVVYLTLAEWRDRRRLEREKRETRRR
jgi:hypothetical protein